MAHSDCETQNEEFSSLLQQQKAFFAAGSTLSKSFRITALNKLLQTLKSHEQDLLSALKKDLGKSYFEGYETELAMVYAEIRTALKHLGQWMRPRKVSTPITHFPAKSRVIWEPYGSALILAPWNYPIQLCLVPLVSALAAGCCAIIKPAEEAGATEKELVKVIQESFSPEHVAVVTGGVETSRKATGACF